MFVLKKMGPRILMFIILTCSNIAWCTDIGTDEQIVVTTTTANVADAVNNFGYKLLITMMKQNKDENVVISPTSVAGLLAMTLLGTVGQTYNELAGALGFSQDIIQNRQNHEQFGDLLRSLNTNDTTSKTIYADAMFIDKESRLRDMYHSYLNRVYKGETVSVDFKQTDDVKNEINQWVASHTEGKIENFLQRPLPVATKAVLLSALYFSGQWEQPFLPNYTSKMAFKNPMKVVEADLMLNMGQFKYIYSQELDLHMVALPYNDSTTTLYALKPRSVHLSLYDLMTRLDSTKINELINKMQNENCVIRFPKMDLQNKAKLEQPLKGLGVQTLFLPGQANFALMVDGNAAANKSEIEILSRIEENASVRSLKDILEGLPNPGLYIDSVIHDVKLTINEYGTEAVAATSGVIGRTAKLFYANSPFYMFIRNARTTLNTFSAIINDPTV